jgi:hypothetical protein
VRFFRRPRQGNGPAVALAAGLLSGLLGGCGLLGDFDRMRPSLVRDDTHAWMGPAAIGAPVQTAWRLQLTDEERKLRDLAYPLIEPPYDRNRWYSVLNEFDINGTLGPHPERGAYAAHLLDTPYRSQTARYNKLIEDIRNDMNRLDPYYSMAHYVLDMDRKRQQSMAYVSRATPQDKANAVQRMKENSAIVRWVQRSLQERVESYRTALERLVISAPAPVSVEAERALTLLQQRIGSASV